MYGTQERLFAKGLQEIQQVKNMNKPAALALLNAIEGSEHKDAFLAKFSNDATIDRVRATLENEPRDGHQGQMNQVRLCAAINSFAQEKGISAAATNQL